MLGWLLNGSPDCTVAHWRHAQTLWSMSVWLLSEWAGSLVAMSCWVLRTVTSEGEEMAPSGMPIQLACCD